MLETQVRQNCHEGELASPGWGCREEATYAYLISGEKRIYLSCSSLWLSRHRILDRHGRKCGWLIDRKVIP